MVFSSWVFLIFLVVVLALYHVTNLKWQNRILLVSSYFFYGWWDWRFLSLLAISTTIDWYLGLKIGSLAPADPHRKRWLTISVVVNLSILGFFKYFNFFVTSVEDGLRLLGFEAHWTLLNVILPMGLSFYTFQSLSYTIDIYRGHLKPTERLSAFALFVSFFPQLVAGPIERATDLLPRFFEKRRVSAVQISDGLCLILIGLFKKVAIADAVALGVDSAFAEPLQLNALQLLRAMYLFAIQIYCDFSGYSDIARGTAKLFGFDLMVNFNQPYFSANITEFWRRWHISLSTWLRDYLYISLGGNRGSHLATYRNLMLTMVLGGLWHGANWTFVIWGFLHGLYLSLHKWILGARAPQTRIVWHSPGHLLIAFLKIFGTFHLVLLTWVFFRAKDVPSAFLILSRIGTQWQSFDFSVLGIPFLYFALLALIDIPQYWANQHTVFERIPLARRVALYTALALALFFLGGSHSASFIYFQF